MRSTFTRLLLMMVICITGSAVKAQVDVSTGGPVISYSTLKDAFDAINAGVHTGTIQIGISGNTTETAKAVLNASGAGSASYTSVVISPTGGAPRTITGSLVDHLVQLNGADYVTIDGLNTGGNALTISNTGTGTATTLAFTGDATHNVITNCTLLGSGTVSFGVVYFGAGTVTGNDENTVSFCNIGQAGTFPLNGIYSMGSDAVIDNSSNVVTDNNIYNYFNASSSTSGMNINSFNTGWTITNNRFYQTAGRTYTSAGTHYGIFITSGAGYTVSGNIIGYADAEGSGTYTMTGTVAIRFIAISMAAGTTTDVNSVQGNTVTSIQLGTSSGASTTYGILCGISATAGNFNIGNVSPNVIGGASGVGLLNAIPTTTQGAIVGIHSASTGTVLIQGNTMGGFSSSGTTASVAGGIIGINISGAAVNLTITGNTIGNSTVNNMRGGTSGLTTGSSIVSGIFINAIVPVCNVSGNTIQNLTSYGSGTTGYVRGIQTIASTTGAGVAQINNNTVVNLTTNCANTTLSNGFTGAQGIGLSYGTGGSVNGNLISNIAMLNTSTGGYVASGIGHGNATNSTIAGNKIWNISNASASVTATTPGVIAGIVIRSGTTAVYVQNNMISLGMGITTNSAILGIYANHGSTPDPADKVYFNSVHIEGVAASGSHPSFGFMRGDFTATARTASVDIRNNIFDNMRGGGTGFHFAIGNNYGATASATGWATGASDYNVLNAPNPAAIGYWTSNQSFAGWKTASASDQFSLTGIATTFANPAIGDLHLNMGLTATQLESGGTVIATVPVDIDGDTRPGPAGSVNGGATAPDLGADEFDGVPLDLTGPTISYIPLGNTASLLPRTLTAIITDPSGVPTTSPGWPTLYWMKSGDPSYTAATPTGISGNEFTFTFGGGVSFGDVVYYYIAAQDNAPTKNVNVFPLAGASGFTPDPPAAAVPPASPSSYNVGGIAGVFYVGAGLTSPDYPTITAAISDLNAKEMTGPVTFILNDPNYSTSEIFPIVINSNPGSSPSNLLTIHPKPGMTSLISGSASGAALILVKNSNTIINGSNSAGTTRDLTIENLSTTTPQVVRIGSTGTVPITNVTLKNSVIINGTTGSSAVVVYGADGAAGYFNNITIQNNSIQKAYIGSYNLAVMAPGNGSGLVITGNNLDVAGANNIRLIGIYVQGVDGATISNNTIGNMANTTDATNITGIWFATGTINSTISGNTISGISGTLGSPRGIAVSSAVANSNVTITGNTITNISSSFAAYTYGINFFSTTSLATIEKNRISNISNSSTAGWSAIGIGLGSSLATADVIVKNNFFWDIFSYGFANLTAGNGYGIQVSSGGGYGILDNSFSLSANQTLVTGLPACLNILSAVTGGLDVRNNIFSITSTVGTNRYAVICNAPASVFSNIDHNDYFTSGPNLGYLGADQADLTAWRAVTGMDLNSISGDPKYISTTDLHIQPAVPSPVRNAGIAIAGISEDIDGNPRMNPPDIGASEDGYAMLSLSAVVDDVSCNGLSDGSVTTTVSGGLAPYTYLWNEGSTIASLTGLGAGTYCVTVTDMLAGIATGCYTVNEPLLLEIVYPNVTPVSCNGGNDGSISINVIGGTTPYSYLWSNLATTEDISGLAAGWYTVSVTDVNGCTASGSWEVLQPVAISVSETITHQSCPAIADGAVDIEVSGGYAPYTYLWSNGSTQQDISGLNAGAYTVTVTDVTGCVVSESYSVTVLAPLCPTLEVNGTVAGTQCFEAANTIYVAAPAPNTFTVVPGGSATFIAGSRIIYLPGTTVLAGGTMHGFIMLTPGPWCVMPPIVASTYTEPGTGQVDKGSRFVVYPNPTEGIFTLKQQHADHLLTAQVVIYTPGGRLILQKEIAAVASTGFDLTDSPAGLYILKVITSEGTETIKVVRTR